MKLWLSWATGGKASSWCSSLHDSLLHNSVVLKLRGLTILNVPSALNSTMLFSSIMNLEWSGLVCFAVNDVSSAVLAQTRSDVGFWLPLAGAAALRGGRASAPAAGGSWARAGTYLGAQGWAPPHRRSHWARYRAQPRLRYGRGARRPHAVSRPVT